MGAKTNIVPDEAKPEMHSINHLTAAKWVQKVCVGGCSVLHTASSVLQPRQLEGLSFRALIKNLHSNGRQVAGQVCANFSNCDVDKSQIVPSPTESSHAGSNQSRQE